MISLDHLTSSRRLRLEGSLMELFAELAAASNFHKLYLSVIINIAGVYVLQCFGC